MCLSLGFNTAQIVLPKGTGLQIQALIVDWAQVDQLKTKTFLRVILEFDLVDQCGNIWWQPWTLLINVEIAEARLNQSAVIYRIWSAGCKLQQGVTNERIPRISVLNVELVRSHIVVPYLVQGL